MPLRPGSRLGHYDVTAQIGQDGMGEVYRARDTTPSRGRSDSSKAISAHHLSEVR